MTTKRISAGERGRVLRILDANANRAGEGLRVVEEYTRFVLDDAWLTGRCKQMRHDLSAALTPWHGAMVRCRDTRHDVGTAIVTDQEYDRADARQLAAANLKRVEQAMRCLEEYSKLLDPSLAKALEAIRYRLYELSQVVSRRADVVDRLAAAQLYLLLDAGQSPESFTEGLRTIAPLVDLIQLRDKNLDDAQLVERARLARQVTREFGVLLVINDRPDLAVLSEADGVHLGQDDVAPADARKIVGPDLLVGVSTHNLEHVHRAVAEGADYIGCGPTFRSTTKRFSDFAGTDFLRAVRGESNVPAFAIGGIHLENLDQVLATGFWRVAVSGCVTGADVPADAARDLRTRLRSVLQQGESDGL